MVGPRCWNQPGAHPYMMSRISSIGDAKLALQPWVMYPQFMTCAKRPFLFTTCRFRPLAVPAPSIGMQLLYTWQSASGSSDVNSSNCTHWVACQVYDCRRVSTRPRTLDSFSFRQRLLCVKSPFPIHIKAQQTMSTTPGCAGMTVTTSPPASRGLQISFKEFVRSASQASSIPQHKAQ